jgi:excinuclease UvrABC ATPase subunit
LQVDLDKVIDQYSPYQNSILPWRDSTFGQTVLKKLSEKYSMDNDKMWKDLPEWFQHVVIYGDEELIRVQT